MQNTQGALFEIQSGGVSETLSKKGFAEFVGVTPGRISQLIAGGLPVEPNGRIHTERAVAWMRANVDSNRRRASLDTPAADAGQFAGHPLTPRGARDVAEAKISQLKAERLAGRMIDRRATLRVVEARAKMEADALIGWVSRVAPAIASATGGDLAQVASILDRELRAHLISMADMPVELPR